jgi:nicotinamide-nucleotide amidase
MKTIIITVGNEVTSGHTLNTNSAYMAVELEGVGLTPERVLTLRDDMKTLAREIRKAAKDYRVVLITGGLGPTHDDVTKTALCKAFGVGLKRDNKTLKAVREFFRRINRPMPAVNETQADVPETCKAIVNKRGTAPLLFFDTGTLLLFAMPGVPYEMRFLMETEVIPILKKRLPKLSMKRAVIRTAGIGESRLYEMIESQGGVPDGVELAYLPSPGQVDLRISATGKNAAGIVGKAVKKLMKVAGPYCFGSGKTTLEEAIGEHLVKKRLTLASAESCTGGRFSAKITSVPGASVYFWEGVVTYGNQSKIKRLGVHPQTLLKYGAVSAEVAGEMARGICKSSGASVGVSITGIAGPGGGTKEKPVGLVYIGMRVGGVVETKKFEFGLDRSMNQERAVKEALIWLWEKVK